MYYTITPPVEITDKKYDDLLEWAWQHGTCFSVTIDEEDEKAAQTQTLLTDLQPHLLLSRIGRLYPAFNECFDECCHNAKSPNFYLYCCCPQTREWLRTYRSLFNWRDGFGYLSVYDRYARRLLYAETFDGTCYLSSSEQAVFDNLPNKELWTLDSKTEYDSDWWF